MTPSRSDLPRNFRVPARQPNGARPRALRLTGSTTAAGAPPQPPHNLRFARSAIAVGDRPLDAFELPPTLRALVWPFESLGAR